MSVAGGMFRRCNDMLKYFFGEMRKANANLIFIARLCESSYSDVDRFKHSSLKPNERLWYNLLHSICSEYGTIYMCYGLDKRAIYSCERQYRDVVMALISRDTEYTLYDGNYQVWSLSDFNIRFLKIARIDRGKLREALDLNPRQMQLMLAICELQPNSKQQLTNSRKPKFPALVKFVKPLHYGPSGFDLNEIASNLSGEQRNELEIEILHVDRNNFNDCFKRDLYGELVLDLMNSDRGFKSVLKFCQKNIYFAYKLINETTTVQKDLLFINIYEPNAVDFIDLVIKVTMKLCGIVFKDIIPTKRPSKRLVKIKRKPNEEAIEVPENIIYPTSE